MVSSHCCRFHPLSPCLCLAKNQLNTQYTIKHIGNNEKEVEAEFGYHRSVLLDGSRGNHAIGKQSSVYTYTLLMTLTHFIVLYWNRDETDI